MRPLLSALAAALVLTGCFQTEAVLTVRADGSARLVETTRAEGYAGLVMMQAHDGVVVSEDPFDPDALARGGAPAEMGFGVVLVSVSDSLEAGAVTRTHVYEIEDVASLQYRFGRPESLEQISGGFISAAFNPTGYGPRPPGTEEIAQTTFRFERQGDALRVIVPERAIATRDVWSPDAGVHHAVSSGSVRMRFAVRAERTGIEAPLVDLRADTLLAGLPTALEAFVRIPASGAPEFSSDFDDLDETDFDAVQAADRARRDAFRALADDAVGGVDRPGLFLAPAGPLTLSL